MGKIRRGVAAGRSHSAIEAPQSILILKPSSFGDIVHTLPAVARLKSAWPDSRISWLINTEWAPLIAENPDVDEVIPFPRQTFRGLRGAARFLRWCQSTVVGRQPDIAVDFQGLLRSALIGRMSRAGVLYGASDAREGARWFYDRVATVPAGAIHAVDRYLMLAEEVLRARGVGDRSSSREKPAFPLPAGSAPNALAAHPLHDFILLHPFARGTGKSLTGEEVEAFCRRLAPRQIVIVGRRGENRFQVPKNAVDLLDQTSLAELIWVIRQAAGVISVDSGPSHLAAALRKPLVAIHTWSDPRRVGPYGEAAWVWKNGRLLPMSQMATQAEAFFQKTPTPISARDIDAICARITSLSDSCA